MAKVELKQPVVNEIKELVSDAASVVLVKYQGINVEKDTELRKECREANVTYKVFKNTMMNFAFKDGEMQELCQHLDGPNAIAVSKEDATAPARILAKYVDSVKPMEFVAGIVEGAYYDSKGLVELSKVPSKEELLSRLLGSIKSPVSNFARVLNQIAEKGGAGACEPAAVEQEAASAAEETKAEPVAE